MKKQFIIILLCSFFYGCSSSGNNKSSDSLKTIPQQSVVNNPSDLTEFEKGVYLKIDEIKSGKIYSNDNKLDVFYRVLTIPEEENIMLIAENISISEEGGGYHLVRRVQLTNDNSVFAKFGLQKIDSLNFVDSVTIRGYFNGKKMNINLNTLKTE
ncbi:MAG: hypothetical protein AAGC65_11655 [Mucilaginibacter sp.]|uniref:hypothetical protein n=1 Tax=Mucilaginibacter sp. TaxID=1882438 RepID=UPI0031A9E67F